jgi:hypothetical protein
VISSRHRVDLPDIVAVAVGVSRIKPYWVVFEGEALCGPTLLPFEFFDFGHICGDARSVFAFARTIATLRLGRVVVFCHVLLLCDFGVDEIRLREEFTSPAPPSESDDNSFDRTVEHMRNSSQ